MVRLLSDENFNSDIVRGFLRSRPQMDIVRVQDVGLEQAEDPEILEWAAADNRIVLTHDRATMPAFAYTRLENGQTMPGMFVVNNRQLVRDVIAELPLIDECSEQREWLGLVAFLPL